MDSKEQSLQVVSSDEREIEVTIEPRRNKSSKNTREGRDGHRRYHSRSKHSPNRMSLFGPFKSRSDTLKQKSAVLDSSLYDPNSKEPRVLSSLELYAPRPVSLEYLPERINDRSDKKQRKLRKAASADRKSRSRDVISVPYISQDDSLNLRHSGIFNPEGWKHRRSKSNLRKPKSESNLYPAGSLQWSPYGSHALGLCLQAVCPQCQCLLTLGQFSPSSESAVTRPGPRGGVEDFYKPRTHPASVDNIPGRIGKPSKLSEKAMRPFQSTSDDSDFYEDAQAPIDHMEIEYVAEVNEISDSNLSMDKQRLIIGIAQEVHQKNESLKDKARYMKLELDKQIGDQWHVIVGVDSFGSHLECLPGALMNFKVKQDVFLVWQT